MTEFEIAKLTSEISDICWTEFLSHYESDHPMPMLQDYGLSWLDGTEITSYQARDHIRNWVRESLEKHGKVVLYTCKDNALIGLDYPTDDDAWEYLEDSGDPNLKGILYFAFD